MSDSDLYPIMTAGFALIPARLDSALYRIHGAAIALQESEGVHRWQIVDRRRPDVRGPARGLWQFERGGGVAGVMTHRASADLARQACRLAGVPWDRTVIWEQLAERDDLAAAFARLLLLTDPRPLPGRDDVEGAWQNYLRNWGPGAHARGSAGQRQQLRDKWGRNWTRALRVVEARA